MRWLLLLPLAQWVFLAMGYGWALREQQRWEHHLFLYHAWKQHFATEVACGWLFYDGRGQ